MFGRINGVVLVSVLVAGSEYKSSDTPPQHQNRFTYAGGAVQT